MENNSFNYSLNKFISLEAHEKIARRYFETSGFLTEEVNDLYKICKMADLHGVHTHGFLKAFSLNEKFGSRANGCIPGAKILKYPSKFNAIEIWDGNKKCGPSLAFSAFNRCMEMAVENGTGTVVVKNGFHYLWGGGYCLDIADKGFIAYTNCTSTLSEVVPHNGKRPAMGTNPHSWAFPTKNELGFNILIDWATSVVSMSTVNNALKYKNSLPSNCGIDSSGLLTSIPEDIVGLAPFGKHKGFGLGLINEILSAYCGGVLPSERKFNKASEFMGNSSFFFQVVNPEVFSNAPNYSSGFIKDVIDDITHDQGSDLILPGEIEFKAFTQNSKNNSIKITDAELAEFRRIENALA